MTPDQNHAEQGLHHLRLAVMDVLAGGQCLGPSEIRRRSGIDKGLGHGARWGHFMTALLDHMEEQGHVERCVQPGGRRFGWRSTSKRNRSDSKPGDGAIG